MRSKKSTNVRLMLMSQLPKGLTLLGSLAPGWAARGAEYLFRSPPRRTVTPEEQEIIARAEREDLFLEGRRLAVYRWGRGPAVLLVHGWGGDAAQLTPLVTALSAAGFSVLAFDAPAHGRSEGKLSSLVQFAAALQALAAERGPVQAVVGHSMGGAAASLAIAGGLKVSGAVFLAPPADALRWWDEFVRTMQLSPRVERLARRRMERNLKFRFDRLNARTMGPAFASPLLVIHDRSDKEVPWTEGATVAATALRARLVTTEGLGHRRIVADPEVAKQTVAFLSEFVQAQDRMSEARALDRELFMPALRRVNSSPLPLEGGGTGRG